MRIKNHGESRQLLETWLIQYSLAVWVWLCLFWQSFLHSCSYRLQVYKLYRLVKRMKTLSTSWHTDLALPCSHCLISCSWRIYLFSFHPGALTVAKASLQSHLCTCYAFLQLLALHMDAPSFLTTCVHPPHSRHHSNNLYHPSGSHHPSLFIDQL